MKWFSVLLLLFAASTIQAADPADSAVISKIVTDGNAKLATAIKSQTKEIADTIKTIVKPAKAATATLAPSTFWSTLLCFLPVIFFLLLFIFIAGRLRRDNIKLSDFLIDKEQQVAIKKEETKVKVANAVAKENLVKNVGTNPESIKAVVTNLHQVDEPVSTQPVDPAQSTSRLVVFMTALTSLLIAVCMTSFYFYRWSTGDQNVDFSKLSTVLYGLGLGIVPYGFSKIASAFK